MLLIHLWGQNLHESITSPKVPVPNSVTGSYIFNMNFGGHNHIIAKILLKLGLIFSVLHASAIIVSLAVVSFKNGICSSHTIVTNELTSHQNREIPIRFLALTFVLQSSWLCRAEKCFRWGYQCCYELTNIIFWCSFI